MTDEHNQTTDEQRAAALQHMTAAIVTAIDQCGRPPDGQVVIGSLATVLGIIARVSGKPDECLNKAMAIAHVMASGALDK